MFVTLLLYNSRALVMTFKDEGVEITAGLKENMGRFFCASKEALLGASSWSK